MPIFAPDKLYQISQIRDLEHRAFLTCEEALLMERVGQAAFGVLRQHYPLATKIVVVCGAGNNGGDGLVLARLAFQAGLLVKVLSVGDFKKQTVVSCQMLQRVKELGISVTPYASIKDFDDSELVVDALLGIGIKGELKAPYDSAIAAMNSSASPIFSLDVPSGLDADTGQACGDCVVAERTITFIGLKQGMVTGKAREYCGVVQLDKIGLDKELVLQESSANLLDVNSLLHLKPATAAYAHKGSQGHVVVIGGDEGMPGAVCLAAEAALRVGAGKVTIVTREKHFAIVMAKRSEFICVTVEEDFSALEHVLNTADVCVVGPGMMLSNWSREVFQRCLQFSGPKVLDAGALALLSETPQFITQAILTPHPGEAAKLLSVPIAEVEANRYQKVAMLAHAYADIVILKGAGTLIFASNDFSVHVCGLGNAGMATAGMGDVLAGMVGGLANQYQGLKKAALAGVLLHSHAGDLAAKALGEQALLAGDLVNYFQWAN